LIELLLRSRHKLVLLHGWVMSLLVIPFFIILVVEMDPIDNVVHGLAIEAVAH
jgi:hypothetical protein